MRSYCYSCVRTTDFPLRLRERHFRKVTIEKKKTQAVIDGNGSDVIEEDWSMMAQSIIHKSMKRITEKNNISMQGTQVMKTIE